MVIIQVVILGIGAINNVVYAKTSKKDTEDKIRRKEFKFVRKLNLEELIKDKNSTEETVQKFIRNINTTSRGTVNRDTEIIEETQYAKISDIKISKNMDLTKRTEISKEDFKKILKNLKQDTSGFFYNNADLIYDLCEEYEINEIFFCGLISAESGWNIASNHRKTHNYISLMSKGKLIKYSSTEEGLRVAAKSLHKNYLTPGGKFYGGKTLSGVQKKFCPSGDWVDLVYGRMKQMMTAVNKSK